MDSPQVSRSSLSRLFVPGLAVTVMLALFLSVFATGVVAMPPQPFPLTTTVTPTPSITPTPATGVDLTIDQFTYHGGSTAVIGDAIGDLFYLTIRNSGTGDATGFWAGVYVSADPAIANGDTLLTNGKVYVSGLAAGDAITVTFPVDAFVPSSVPPGGAYFIAAADKTFLISEINEGNNTTAVSVTLIGAATATPTATPSPTPTLSPDLLIDLFTYSGPTDIINGEPIGDYFDLEIRNAGTAVTNGFWVGLYASLDQTISSADTLLLGGHEWVAGLAAGQAMTITYPSSAAVPNTVPPGPAYIGAFVDKTDYIPESDETNNTSAWAVNILAPTATPTPTPVPRPDLAIYKDLDGVVAEGGMAVYRIDFQNLGNADAFNVRISDTLPAGMTFLGAVAGQAGNADPLPTTPWGNGDLLWGIGAVPAGSYDSIILLASLDVNVFAGSTITNAVAIGGAHGEKTLANNEALHRTVVDKPEIVGSVLDPTGQPVGFAEIVATNALAVYSGAHTWSRPDGWFSLGGLTSGTYHLQVLAPPDSTWPASIPFTVTVQTDSPQDVGEIYLGNPQIAGQVVLPDGTAGLGHAYVLVESSDGTTFADTLAGGQGFFRFWALEPGRYRLQAYPPDDVPGYAPSASRWIDVVDTTTTYEAGRIPVTIPTVFGKVVDPAGNDASYATVLLSGNGDSFMQIVKTDAQGIFAFGGLPVGHFFVQAFPPEGTPWSPSLPEPVDLVTTVASYNVGILRLTTPAVIGQITDPTGTTGLEGAAAIVHDQDWRTVAMGETEPDGSFKLGGLPAGWYELDAMPPDGNHQYAPNFGTPVQVISGTISYLGAVPLNVAQVQGQIVEPDGAAHRSGSVTIHGSAAVNSQATEWTVPGDWAGWFQIGGLDPSMTYSAQAHPRHYGLGLADSQSVALPTVAMQSTGAPTLTLMLRHANLDGQVVDDTGVPLESVAVVLYSGATAAQTNMGAAGYGTYVPDTAPTLETWLGTDYNGRFAFGGLGSGTYWLQAFPPPNRPDLFRSEPVEVTVLQGGITHLGSPLMMQRAVKQLTVAVVREDSTLVTDGQVTASQRGSTLSVQATANGDDLYHLGLAGGEWEVSVAPLAEGANWTYTKPPQIVAFDKGNQPESKGITMTVTTADAHVIGKVVDPDGSPPPAGSVFVDVRNDEGTGNGAETDSNGQFDVAVPPGVYHVAIYVLSGDLAAPELPPFKVESGEIANLDTIHLERMMAQITGQVTREDTGAGVPNIGVKAWNIKGDLVEALTDANGSYSLTVAPGAWYVGVSLSAADPFLPDVPPQRVPVQSPGETVSGVDFMLTPTQATIQGTVVNEFGQLMPEVDAWVYAREGNSVSAVIAGGGAVRNGQFSFPVPAGSYMVGLILPPGSPFVADPEQAVAVGPGDTATLTLVVRTADATIIGHFELGMSALTQIAPQPLGVIGHVFASGGDGQDWHSAPIYADGRFTLTVAAGTWRVSYRIEDEHYVAPEQESFDVTVGPGEVYDLGAIPLLEVDSEIRGVAKQPDGAPFPGALVWAVRMANGRQLRFTAEASDPDGTFTLRVPAGTYRVGAVAPQGNAYSGYRSPPVETVHVEPGTPATLTLQFWLATARLDGTVGFPGTGGIIGVEGAYLWGWSEQGAHVQGTSTTNGTYRLWLSPGRWHVGAVYQDDAGNVFQAAPFVADVSVNQLLTHDFALKPAGQLPSGRTVSFDTNELQVIHLDDGTEVRIPAGALADSGRVWVVVAPAVTDVPHTWLAKPLKFGYTIQAFDDRGRQITGGFHKNVLISFRYDEADLPAGASEDRIIPLYFSTTTDSWTPVDSYTLDPVANRVTAEINHFSMWADSMWADSMWADGVGGALGLPVIMR